MKAHELARRANMSVHTVRYYARCGLLAPSRNQFNNYREYTERDLTRLRFIEVSKCLGLTLDEIRAVFATDEHDGDLRELLHDALHRHLAEQESAIEQLNARRHAIDCILRAWARLPWDANEVTALCEAMRQLAGVDSHSAPASARPAAERAEDTLAKSTRRTTPAKGSQAMAATIESQADRLEASRSRSGSPPSRNHRSSSELVKWLYSPSLVLAASE